MADNHSPSCHGELADSQRAPNILRPPSPEFFSQVESWIDECGHRHRQCPLISGEPPPLPTRVLKIARSDQGAFHVRLDEGQGRTLRFATLSHCWGQYQPVKTTKANLADHLREVEWSALPKTFQDAVIITHGLGLEYLWIDSLCIVQDDKDDWGKEAGEMKNVYGYSYVTIAAAVGEDSRSGLFQEEEFSGEPSTKTTAAIACIRDALPGDSEPPPLFTRAWILQERLLASRILYFYKQEVVFECSNHIRCQCSGVNTAAPIPDPWASMGVTAHYVLAQNSLRNRFAEAMIRLIAYRLALLCKGSSVRAQDLWPVLPFDESCKMLELWDEVVHKYCRRKITRLSDRLTALSGIAGVFGSTGAYGAYYGGMWQIWQVHMMLWYVSVEDGLVPDPPSDQDQPLAPSWSWAKVRGAWCYRRPPLSMDVVAELIKGELHLAVRDRFGALEKGIITVEGKLTNATVHFDTPSSPALSWQDRFVSQKVKLVKDSEEGQMRPDSVLDGGSTSVQSGDEVFCLGITVDQTQLPPAVHGVVLRKEGDPSSPFSRIGMFRGPLAWFQSCGKTTVTIC